ncbi:type IV secretion system DNA-binding domain-containing protein [Pseudomonas aeruginosa]|nr:type IV secretion system DNA-binding domain-containing protein [Pseudomonas aeruginosa]
MAARVHNRHSDAALEVDASRYFRANHTHYDRMVYGIQDYAPYAALTSGILSLAAPGLTEVCAASFLASAGAYMATQRKHGWPLCVPCTESNATPIHKAAWKLSGNGKLFASIGLRSLIKDPRDVPGDGVVYLGSDMDNGGAQLWTSLDYLVRHLLLIGSTGSGKTQVILGMIMQLMSQGSGAIFIDGKADVTTWFYLYTLARHFGLERQLLVINYLTAGGAGTKRSNTTNIFEVATADSLMEMVSSMMGEAGGNDGMWRGRADALFGIIIRAGCEDRDLRGDTIVPDNLREMMGLNLILEMPNNMKYSERVRREAQLFLNDLPGYSAFIKATTPQAKEQSMGRMSEQLGFLQMQFTRILGLLSGTYGYITGTDISEIDWIDVINQRRTLYVMLPALEKSPESLKQLGRMVVSSIRNAVLPIVGGGKLTGSKRLLVDSRPIGKSIPYGMFFDEYGSYCVDGFGDVVAQIRSMGVFACFAGQDWASFKKGSEVEADRVNANTNMKIFLKTFDVNTTDLLIKTAGKRLMSVAGQWSSRPSGAAPGIDTKFQSVESLSVQEQEKAKIEILAAQPAGMAHIYFSGKLWTKVKMYYPNIKQAAQSQVNSFVRMRTPKGISGVMEDAEKKLSYQRMVAEWAGKLNDRPELDAAAEKEIIPGFCRWNASLEQAQKVRGFELIGWLSNSIMSFEKDRGGQAKQAAGAVTAGGGTSLAGTPPAVTAPTPPAATEQEQGGSLGRLKSIMQAEAPVTAPSAAVTSIDDDFLPPPGVGQDAGPEVAGPTIVNPKSAGEAGSPIVIRFTETSDEAVLDMGLDADVEAGVARTATSSYLIQRGKELSRRGADDTWQSSAGELRASANTMVEQSIPIEQSEYPKQPVPASQRAGQLRQALEQLRSQLLNTGSDNLDGTDGQKT